ncbi:MAG TPA: MFS transporter [Ktedonobacteraceae bacterium]|nr:MFS transporter [Ktedonobacteraceae bacterium]
MFSSLKFVGARSPLRSGAFLRLWLGLSISYMGDPFTTIGLLWYVLQLTGSGVAISLVLLCFQLPGMLTGPLLGMLLDRWQPRLVIGIDNTLRALLIGAIPALSLLGVLQLWHIYVLALLAGALSPATGAGIRVLLPQLVAESELDRANALTSTSMQFSWLLGPALAGIVVSQAGGAFALFIDAISFLLMGLLIFSLPPVSRHMLKESPQVKESWFGGFALLFGRKEIRLLTCLSFIFFFSYGPLEAALPLYSDRILHVGAQGYGLLWTGFGVGALVGALLTGFVAARARPGLTQPLIAILWGGFLCPLLIIRSLPLALICLALGACSWAPYTPIEASLLQRLIPPSMRGRVFGARFALITASAPLGTLIGGFLLEYVSASIVIGISGLACILAGVAGFASPTIRSLGRPMKNDLDA